MDYLHEDLTHGFKVVLAGEDFPAEFQDGDILDVYNSSPEDGEYMLVKRNSKYEIYLFREESPVGIRSADIIGSISSFERSCRDGDELFLGDEPEAGQQCVPKRCSDCEYVQVVELIGKAVACCHSGEELKRVGSWLDRCDAMRADIRAWGYSKYEKSICEYKKSI